MRSEAIKTPTHEAASSLFSPLSPQVIAFALLAAALSGCGTVAKREGPAAPSSPAPQAGGYYLNDGPGDHPPANLNQIPDAVPKREPLQRGSMRPYTVLGQNYTPMTQLTPYKARGIASWYGRRYHGQKTSSGEIYDMYGMSAAHTILPIPSYARVTNVATGKSVVVRINDRGPFHSDRLIDLSYTAAYKLGVLGGGKALVDVESIIPDAGTATTPTIAAAPAPIPPPPPVATTVPATPLLSPVAIPLPAEPGTQAGPPPAATPEPVAATPVVMMASEQKGMFLQLGAFGSQDNAENYVARLRAQIDWLAPLLHVYPKDGLFRVHAGPYANQADARAAADRITQALGIKAMVLTR